MDEPLKPYIFDATNGLWYKLIGDYYFPCIALPQEEPDDRDYVLGKFGLLHYRYLQQYRPALYCELLLNGKLHSHLVEIDKTCKERLDIICKAMAKQEGVTEALKASDQMAWVRHMNSIRSRAEEIVLNELVYDG